MQLAHRVCHSSQSVLSFDARPGMPHGMNHSGACPRRKYGEEDIVKNHEKVENTCLAQSPWLVLPLMVPLVDYEDGDGIDQCNGNRVINTEQILVEP